MSKYDPPQNGVSVLQLNSELQQIQLDLLSAHCAVHQLRLHYSSDDLARFGRRDLLRKSADAANALHNFYSQVTARMQTPDPGTSSSEPTSDQIIQGIEWVVNYMLEQRDLHAPVASPLAPEQKASMWPYFSPALLDQMLIIELQGARVAVPKFFDQVQALGFEPPQITHMDSVTFLDVIVFNQQLSQRALFHALVHSVQIQLLGLPRYAELWVRSFVKTRTHFTVPLEVQAFSLASKFSRPAPERFSVEEQVLRWIAENRY